METQVLNDILFEEHFATLEMTFRGSPEQGMLAWLDGQMIQEWWPAENINIEPARNGMYYIAWKDPDLEAAFAVLGVLGTIDTENHFFEVNKILLISPFTRFSNFSFRVSFEQRDSAHSQLCISVSTPFAGSVRTQFNELLEKLFPLLQDRFVRHLHLLNG